ncbi:hypothetical protein QUF75_19755 [Desulfococcaceae bacterium HSG7]|nr:hypothetical protein [Desulfococcaceae bacterium HSG7]
MKFHEKHCLTVSLALLFDLLTFDNVERKAVPLITRDSFPRYIIKGDSIRWI